MNMIISILGLIITIMSITNNRIFFMSKLTLTVILAAYIYGRVVGPYTIWWEDRYWTQENINTYFKNGPFLKAFIIATCTYVLFYWITVWLIKQSVKRFLSPFVDNRILNSQTTTNQQKFKKYINEKIKAGVKLAGNITNYNKNEIDITDNMISYNQLLGDTSVYISFVIQCIIVWLIVYGISLLSIILIIIVGFIAISILAFLPIYKANNKEIQQTIIDELNSNL